VVNDTISDTLTRIRNANMVKHQIVQVPSTQNVFRNCQNFKGRGIY
jgi:ribosomal protein S8